MFFTILTLEIVLASGQLFDLPLPNRERTPNTVLPCVFPEIIVFNMPVGTTPEPEIRLYTSDDPAHYVLLSNRESVENSKFDSSQKTVIFVHGHSGTADDESVIFIKHQVLTYMKVNFIAVDYRDVALKIDPTIFRHLYNTGKYVADKLELIKEIKGLILETVHIIAWSLGTQLAGAIGSQLRTGKLGKITACDPGAFCFMTYSNKHKLDISDANFLVVISTTAGLILYDQPLGHLHFWLDGGYVGRSCGDQKSGDDAQCSHAKSVYMYGFSMVKYPECVTVAYRCPSYDDYEQGRCYKCGNDGRDCAIFGIRDDHFESKKTNTTAVMYTDTTFTDTQCMFQYNIRVILADAGKKETGRMNLVVNGTSDCKTRNVSTTFFLKKTQTGLPQAETFEPGQTYTYLVNSHVKMIKLNKVSFVWYTSGNAINELYVRCVIFEPMNNIQTDRSNLTTYATWNIQQPIFRDQPVTLTLSNSCNS